MAFYKRPWFYIPMALVVVLIIVFIIVLSPNGKTPARIQTASGDVQVNKGTGYAPASVDMELSQGDLLKTGADGNVVLVLYEKVIVRLEPNTEIAVSALAANEQSLDQKSGTVWTKVAKIGGVEKYEIQTPTTTATVRGTVLKTGALPYVLLVGEGVVLANNNNDPTKEFSVTSDGKLVQNQDGSYSVVPLTPQDKKEIYDELQQEIDTLRALRLREIQKNDLLMSVLESEYHATPESIANYLIDVDEGRVSEDEMRAKAGSIPAATTVFEYNAEVKKTLETQKRFA